MNHRQPKFCFMVFHFYSKSASFLVDGETKTSGTNTNETPRTKVSATPRVACPPSFARAHVFCALFLAVIDGPRSVLLFFCNVVIAQLSEK